MLGEADSRSTGRGVWGLQTAAPGKVGAELRTAGAGGSGVPSPLSQLFILTLMPLTWIEPNKPAGLEDIELYRVLDPAFESI